MCCADAELQRFWYQLDAVQQLSWVDSAQLLYLGNNLACFPLEGRAVRGTLLVRQCYVGLSQILRHHIAAGGLTFIITGTSGDSLLYDTPKTVV